MFSNKLLTASGVIPPVEIVSHENFIDTADRRLYTFNGTLDPASNEYVVGLLGVRNPTASENSSVIDPVVTMNGVVDIVDGFDSGFASTVGYGIAGDFGSIINPVSTITAANDTDAAIEATAVHVILSGVNSILSGGQYRSNGTQTETVIEFNVTPPEKSIVLACVVADSTSGLTWSGATQLYNYTFGSSRFTVAYVVGDGNPVSFSVSRVEGTKGYEGVAITFAP